MNKLNDAPTYLPINHWAESDRPREKMRDKGKLALSDAELLAILIGSGTVSLSAVELAKQILKLADNNLHKLAQLSLNELKSIKGIGEAKAITIMSALELGRRRKEANPLKREQITCSRDAYQQLVGDLLDLKHEEFWVLFLNKANVVIKKDQISIGGVTGTVADPKLIFKRALELVATGIIIAHNHPSGNLSPSPADIQITDKMKAGGKLLDIAVLDHLIITNEGYYSFADEGRI